MIVKKFKVPAKAIIEVYWWRLILRHCTWVGRKAGEWNDWGWYTYENECAMEVRNPSQKCQKRDVSAWNRLRRKRLVEEISIKFGVKVRIVWCTFKTWCMRCFHRSISISISIYSSSELVSEVDEWYHTFRTFRDDSTEYSCTILRTNYSEYLRHLFI